MDSLPEWSKGVDSSSTSASCVGSNPTAVMSSGLAAPPPPPPSNRRLPRSRTTAGHAGGRGGRRGEGQGRARPPAPASAESLLRGWASKASAPPSAGDISVALAQTPAAIVRPGRPPGGRSAALVVERESRQGVAGGGHRPVGLMDKASASGAGDSRFESWAGQDFRGGRFRSLPGAGGDWRGLAGGARRPAPAPGANASASLSRSPRLAAPRQRRPWSIQARRLSQVGGAGGQCRARAAGAPRPGARRGPQGARGADLSEPWVSRPL